MITITNENKKLQGMKFIDLFAGIGGFYYALSSFGAKCVFVSEWDKFAAETYEANHKIKPAGDITLIDESNIPSHDILCAGFPCQAFSISGKQNGFEDTRGTLFFDIARIVSKHKPKVLFLENVKNLIRHDNGKTIDVISSTLNNLGYNIYYQILNTSDYGLPQNRERIYIIGFRKDISINPFNFPKPDMVKTSLTQYLEKNPSDAKIIKRDDIDVNRQQKVD